MTPAASTSVRTAGGAPSAAWTVRSACTTWRPGSPRGNCPTAAPGGTWRSTPGGGRTGFWCTPAVEVRDLDPGGGVASLQHPPQFEADHLAWHPDGETLAVVGSDSRDSRIDLWDVAAGKQT